MNPALVLVVLLLQAATPPAPRPPAAYPFGVGERFEYSAKLGIIRLGNASMTVAAIDTVRGQPAFNFRFRLTASNILIKLDDVIESWTTVRDLRSLRFRQDHDENDSKRVRVYEIHADSGFFRMDGRDPEPTVADPLDDAAFLYYVRSMPLEVGKTYRLSRYFKKEKNPLVIRVLKREKMKLPDDTEVTCLLLHPQIDDRGMFAPRQEARLWLTDDERRIPVQIRSKYPWGTVTLRLEKMTLPP